LLVAAPLFVDAPLFVAPPLPGHPAEPDGLAVVSGVPVPAEHATLLTATSEQSAAMQRIA
jgi:hypothetical protein